MSKHSFHLNSPILRLERLDKLGSLENYLVIANNSLSMLRNFNNWINFKITLFFSLFYGLLYVFKFLTVV